MVLLLNLSPLLILVGFGIFTLFAKHRFRTVASKARAGRTPLENLVPLAAYDLDEAGYYPRFRLLTGAVFGLGFALIALFLPPENSAHPPIANAAFSLFVLGPIAGCLFPLFVRAQTRLVWTELHSGGMDSAPSANRFYYQVPCTMLGSNPVVPGVLYIGREGLEFQPRGKNSKPIPMVPLESIRATLADPPVGNWLQQRMVARRLPVIGIAWAGGSAQFWVPTPTVSCEKIRRAVETLQAIPR